MPNTPKQTTITLKPQKNKPKKHHFAMFKNNPLFFIIFNILACWLSQNNQNKVIIILFIAQYFCRNKSLPIRTSHNNAFVARVFLSLDFAICLFPQFLTSMWPFSAVSSKWRSRFRSETRFFP